MGSIWEPSNRFRKWLEVEIAACEAWAKLGKIPQKSLNTIIKKADFNVERIDEIEKTVKHDVIAFLTSVAEFVGPDSRYIHMGLTSSDDRKSTRLNSSHGSISYAVFCLKKKV